MTNLRYLIAPITFGLVLTCASACKYTGDSEPEQSTETSSAPAAEETASKKPQQAVAPDAGAEQPEESPLGEGTDVQRRLLAKAKQAFLTEQMDRAEQLFEALSKTEPVSGPQVSAVIALAQIYNESERAEKAIELYDGLADRVDDIPEIQLVIARAYADQGESTRAIEAYQKLLETQPDYVFAWVELGKLYTKAGREEEATKALYTYEKRVYSLAKKLEDAETKPAERIHILDIFSLVSDDRATEATAKMLGADEPLVRQRAASVLGETGATETKEVLEKVAVNDPHLGVRMAAKDALERLEKGGAPAGPQIGPAFVDDEEEIPAE